MGTKIIVGWVLALLIAIGVAVGIMSAVWSPPAAPSTLSVAVPHLAGGRHDAFPR